MTSGGKGGSSPARLADVALTMRSNGAASSCAKPTPWTAPRSQNAAARVSARCAVRLAITTTLGASPSSGPRIPRVAPPAPMTSTRRWVMTSPRLSHRSRTRPAPSVLSPRRGRQAVTASSDRILGAKRDLVPYRQHVSREPGQPQGSDGVRLSSGRAARADRTASRGVARHDPYQRRSRLWGRSRPALASCLVRAPIPSLDLEPTSRG